MSAGARRPLVADDDPVVTKQLELAPAGFTGILLPTPPARRGEAALPPVLLDARPARGGDCAAPAPVKGPSIPVILMWRCKGADAMVEGSKVGPTTTWSAHRPHPAAKIEAVMCRYGAQGAATTLNHYGRP